MFETNIMRFRRGRITMIFILPCIRLAKIIFFYKGIICKSEHTLLFHIFIVDIKTLLTCTFAYTVIEILRF